MIQIDTDIHDFKSVTYVSSKDLESHSFYLWIHKNNDRQNNDVSDLLRINVHLEPSC